MFNTLFKRPFHFPFLLVLIGCLFSSTFSFAQLPGDAWGTVCAFGNANTPQGNLVAFDKTTGNATVLGSVCGNGTTLLTGEFVDGIYYAINQSTKELVTVAADGSCTTIGTATYNGNVTGLSHDITTGITYLLSAANELHTIDLETGATTFIGTTSQLGISLVIDGAGNAYIIGLFSNSIHEIDLATAAVSPGVPLTRNGNPLPISFAQDIDADCDDNTGELIGIVYSGGGTGRLGTINPTTGVFTQRAFIGSEICGFSINNIKVEPAPPIPTLSQWSLLIFTLLLLNLSVGLLFKKEKQLKTL